jgi:hypothetical protein
MSDGAPAFATRKEMVRWLTADADKNYRIKEKHQVAHIVASWSAAAVDTGSMAATASRLLARVGIDPLAQRVVVVAHLDGPHAHLHIMAARVRSDGGAWVPGLGVDRALALESAVLAREAGQPWDQRMIARSARSGAAAGLAADGELHGEIRYEDGRRERIAWQGLAVAERVEASAYGHAEHAGICVAKMVGYRPAVGAVRYAT